MAEKIKVNIKWGKTVLNDVEVDTSDSIESFQTVLYSLTNVPPSGQKVMVPRSGPLKPGAAWSKYKLKDGATWMLVGTAEEKKIEVPTEATLFIEDLDLSQTMTMKVRRYPPGLINLGNTCYMNSTIQFLGAAHDLRQAVEAYATTNPARESFQGGGGGENEAVAASLGGLFRMMGSTNNALPPLGFLNLFRTSFPQFAQQGEGGRYMQQDADECFQQVMRCLERVPSQIDESRNIVSEVFTGEMVSTMRCVEIDGAEPEPSGNTSFFKLACHIDKQTNFLHDGLKAGLVEHITKHSEALGRDAVFEKSSRISKLPVFLCVQFVRFWWNQHKQVKAKIARPVEFPMRLDMIEYCTDELRERMAPFRAGVLEWELHEDAKRKEAKFNGEGDGDQMDVEGEASTFGGMEALELPDLENETGWYNLKAVITHQGRMADSGHYVAWVRQEGGTWLLFDDDKVTSCNEEDIKKLAGKGGADWHIAYLCLYEMEPKVSLEYTKQDEL